jgi:predicted HTH domain antitoxin
LGEDLLMADLCQERVGNALALLKRGDISLWKAAFLAGVSLREMAEQAITHGLRAGVDKETISEELDAWSS